MSKRVFVVTEGEYSDYGIVSLFESREDAWAAVERNNARTQWYGEHARIEEWELYSTGERPWVEKEG